MCVCMCVHACVCVYMYVYMCVCVRACACCMCGLRLRAQGLSVCVQSHFGTSCFQSLTFRLLTLSLSLSLPPSLPPSVVALPLSDSTNVVFQEGEEEKLARNLEIHQQTVSALQYRVAKKRLLAAAAGDQVSACHVRNLPARNSMCTHALIRAFASAHAHASTYRVTEK